MAESDLGTDFAGGTDLSPSLSLQRGRRALADAVTRRLTTPRGGLLDAPEYGFDLRNVLGTSLNDNAISQRILEQVRAEEEVEEASVTIDRDDSGEAVAISVGIVGEDGPFSLTLSVDNLEPTAIIPGGN